jgi:hypothetical protein
LLWLVILLTITVLFTICHELKIQKRQKILSTNIFYFYHYCLRFDRGVISIVVAGNILYHYCLRFDRGEVHIVVAVLLLPITVLAS